MTELSGRAVFLDRDGTIIRDRHYLCDPEGVELMPGAADGLSTLQSLGFLLAVVTNQSGIGRGYFDMEAVEAVHERLDRMLAALGVTVDGYFVCPHTPSDGCQCRKPAPGLILSAAHRFEVGLGESFTVGDQRSDIRAGQAAGTRTVMIAADDPGLTQESDARRPYFRARDLAAAARYIAGASGLAPRSAPDAEDAAGRRL